MSDLIEISNIRAWGKHGVTDLERARAQLLQIDVQLSVELELAGASDLLSDTIDYARLHSLVVETVESTSFKLLEALSAKIIGIFFEDKRVIAATVKIAKPEKLAGATPSVTIQRANK